MIHGTDTWHIQRNLSVKILCIACVYYKLYSYYNMCWQCVQCAWMHACILHGDILLPCMHSYTEPASEWHIIIIYHAGSHFCRQSVLLQFWRLTAEMWMVLSQCDPGCAHCPTELSTVPLYRWMQWEVYSWSIFQVERQSTLQGLISVVMHACRHQQVRRLPPSPDVSLIPAS